MCWTCHQVVGIPDCSYCSPECLVYVYATQTSKTWDVQVAGTSIGFCANWKCGNALAKTTLARQGFCGEECKEKIDGSMKRSGVETALPRSEITKLLSFAQADEQFDPKTFKKHLRNKYDSSG